MGYVTLRRAVRNSLGPAAIDLVQWLACRRDWAGAQRVGRWMGEWAYKYHARYRNVAIDNIRLAYGDELSDTQVREIARGSLRHVTTLFVEALRLASMSADECRRIATIQGEHHLKEALEQGRGAVIFSGHLGNWEIAAVRLIHEHYNLLPLSRPPSTRRLAAKFREIRDKLNFPIIPVSEGMRGIFRALKANCIVPVMPDRYAKGQGVTVPFFGHPTHVWQTPALLHARTGCAILPVHTLRRPDGTFLLEIEGPVPMQESEDREADLVENTARLMAILEQKIRVVPEQYAWHYHLWRAEQPGGMPVAKATQPQPPPAV
jgi:Kdo2-lipid IVA lauroyltransferase/acyltransferase